MNSMKVTKLYSLDYEVVKELESIKNKSSFVNEAIKKALEIKWREDGSRGTIPSI